MERRALLMSLGLSALAMFLVYQFVSSKEKQLQEDYGTFFPMVVASRDILQYETIRPTDIEVVRIPRAMATYSPGRIEDPKDVIDAVAAIPISKGEHILDNKIISKNIYSGLDTQISLGKRAVSILVNMKSGVGFHLRPGNRIDLAAHFEYKAQGANISEVKVFMQDLLVLAAGRTIQATTPKAVDQSIVRTLMSNADLSKANQQEVRDTLNFAKTDPNYITVTLEVTPEQAQQIAYVQTVFPDSMMCFLRHSDDRQLERYTTMNLLEVMGPDSHLGRGPKISPPRAVAQPKYYDFMGTDMVPAR